jgi:membrane fusion protein (multidrug efflux system)
MKKHYDCYFRITFLFSIISSSILIGGCNKNTSNNALPPAGANFPIPEVSVVNAKVEEVTISTELPGRLEATRVAQVRARASGIVLARVYKEGSDVKAGQMLFKIDSAPLQATFNSSRATLEKAQANLAQVNVKLQRYKPLVESNAISKQEYDDIVTAQKQALADVGVAKANQENAKLNLGYAFVTAPISGRIGRALVTEGALVGQGEATPMALIQQINPIYVTFTQSSSQIAALRKSIQGGELKALSKDKEQSKVTLITEDGTQYSNFGKLLFSEMSVDESTGSVTLRAEFPNKDKILLPGMYVRVKINQGVREQAITLPQQAVMRTLDGAFVMMVGQDGKIISKAVKTSGVQNNKWIITDGIKVGDKVIVEGLNKFKPDMQVKPIEFKENSPKI